MNWLLESLINFIGIFLVIYIIYTVFVNKKREDYEKLKRSSEVRIIIDRYHLNMKKIKYKNLLRTITIINSFILSFSAVVIINIDSLIYSILVGFVIVMVLTYSSYEILGRYYQKKGRIMEE